MNGRRAFLYIALFFFSFCPAAFSIGVPQPNSPNLNNDGRADYADFALLANNWRQTGANLQGDLDDSNAVDVDDLMTFCWYWLDEYSEYQQCQRIDLDSDGIIAFEDIARFAQNWLTTGAGLAGDFDDSNSVDSSDLSVLADCWLCGSRQETIFAQFKNALTVGDVNTALTFMSETSRDKYAEVFQIIGGRLPDYAAGMGDLILKSNSENDGEIKYEMTHQAGGTTYLFPVIFVKDQNDIWRIYSF